MFRRARFSVRPNVGTAGRTTATPQDPPSASQEATAETPKEASESSTATATDVTENKTVVTPSEKATGPGVEQNVEGASSSSSSAAAAAVQRRKRVTIKPKVAPGRPSAAARTPKSPVKAPAVVPETPVVPVPESDLDSPAKSTHTGTTAAPAEESETQPQPTLTACDSSEPTVAPPVADLPEQLSADTSSKRLEITAASQVKEAPSTPLDFPFKVPPSLPDKAAIEISEKAKTLISSKGKIYMSPPEFSLSRLLNDPSDLHRLAKARKLRDLLKQEMHKDKKIKRAKAVTKEFTIDPAKMTMRELIRYLPLSNPMTSSVEESVPENETVVPPSPRREKSPERAQEPEVAPKIAASPRVDGAEGEDEDEEADEDQDDSFMVPQVKVAEDGTLIIDEESLTVEVQRAKGPNLAQERDAIFERGSTTTYSSFRKGTYTKPWSSEETDMYFLAISMVGTDFSMICQLFPHRARSEIKNKFKKEERQNAWRIDKAFKDRRKLDIEYFSKLLEKILEVQKNRKKLKSLVEKNSPKKRKRNTKGKKAGKKLSDVEEDEEEEDNTMPDLEGEKENEDLCNDGGTPVSKPKTKRKRKSKKDASTEEPNDKKNKKGETSNEQDEADIPEDAEAALPEDNTNTDISENLDKDTAIKPAKLSRGRPPKPILPLGRSKRGKKPLSKEFLSEDGEESVSDGASKEQEKKDASPLRQADKRKSANDDIPSDEEEEATVKPPRPTRYGRVPKAPKPLNYPAKEDSNSSASESTHKPKPTAKRRKSSKQQSAQESKKPKLVTLRASQSEYSDDENEKHSDEEEVEEDACCSTKDSEATAFVPASLRSPHPFISEVEETMEELDIFANMPDDVLGMSQDALCRDASCEQAHNETCEHQLDLLVDVIDFLSSENPEVSEDESYNEAAHTLLAIGNIAHLSQSAHDPTAAQDHTPETASCDVNETSQHLEEESASKPDVHEEESSSLIVSATSRHKVEDTSETVATVEPQNSTADEDDIPVIETSDQKTDSDVDPASQLPSSPDSSKKSYLQTRRGRSSMVKPKPNIRQASRTAQSKSQPETSTVRTAIDDHAVVSDLSLSTETQSETPKIANRSQTRDSKSTSESTDEIMMSSVGTTESSCSNLLTSDLGVPESQVELDSTPIQESTEHPAPCVSNVEELPVSQKEESDDASTSQTRRSRFQKVKPKPNIRQVSRTAQSKSKPETSTVKTAIEDSAATSNLSQSTETPSETPSSQKLLKDDISCIEVKPTEEPSGRQEASDVQVKSSAATSDQSVPGMQSQCSSDSKIKPSLEQAARDSKSTSESTDEIMMPSVGTTESSCSNLQPESQVELDSAPIQESTEHPAPCVSNVEELPVSQKEESDDASTSQTRRSRFQKVKPKPNIGQKSRTVRSKPQTTKDPVEKDSNPTQFHEISILEVEAEPSCHSTPAKPSERTGPASDVIPSLDLGSTLTVTEELSTTEEKKTDVGIVEGQAESGTATSEQIALENKNFSETRVEPSSEQPMEETRPLCKSTDKGLMSHDGTTESSCSNLMTSASAVPETEVALDSAPLPESIDQPSPCVTRVEELPVSQKEEREDASPRQTRVSRFQKVKPKPNLVQKSRTAHSKPQTAKDSNLTSDPKFHEKTTFDVEAEPISNTSPDKPSEITAPASDVIQSLDLGSTLPTEELSKTDQKKIDVGIVEGRVKSGAATADKNAFENKNFSETQCEPTREQATTDTRPAFEIMEVTTESSCTNPPSLDSAVPESHVEQMKNITSAPVQDGSDNPASCVTLLEELPVIEKKESEVTSTCLTKRDRLQEVKAVTLTQLVEQPSSSTSRPESQPTCSTGIASVAAPSVESCSTHKSTEELSSTEEPMTDVGLESSSEGSQKNVPQRMQRFPKVKPKPNFGSSSRMTQLRLKSKDISKPSEQAHKDTSSNVTLEQPAESSSPQTEKKPTDKDSKHSTPKDCSVHLELLSSTMFGPVESEKSQDSTNNKGAFSEATAIATSLVAENQSMMEVPVLENKSSEESTVERESTGDKTSKNDKVEAGPASQSDCQQDLSISPTKTNTQPADQLNLTAILEVLSSEDGITESNMTSLIQTETQSTPDPEKNTQESSPVIDSQSQDDVQQTSETTQTNQPASRSSDVDQSEQTDSSTSSSKAPKIRRGRLVKPRPNLGRSSQPKQPTQVGKSTAQTETDSGNRSDGVNAAGLHKPESVLQPDTQKPVEGALEQHGDNNPPSDNAGPSLGGLTQALDNSTQDVSTVSTGGAQSDPGLTLFPHMLSEPVPSDPDEPFFILSLTEVPVCLSGDAAGIALDPLPNVPVTDASIEQPSVPGEGLVVASVAVPVSMEVSGEAGPSNVKDIGPDRAACSGPIMENPVDPHDGPTIQPPKLQETTESKDETGILPTKQKGRRVKLQVKPNPPRRSQPSRTVVSRGTELTPVQTDTTQESELPGSSVQPKATDDGGKDPKESSSGAQTKQTRGPGSRNRNPKGSTPCVSETSSTAPPSVCPPVKAASRGSKVKTPRAEGKLSVPKHVASTSFDDVTPTPGPTQPHEETHQITSATSPTHTAGDSGQNSEHSWLHSDPTSSSSQFTSQVSTSQFSECLESSSIEEEPTNVSQYFLSDIFTEVEEG